MRIFDIPANGEIKILPSGIVIECEVWNFPYSCAFTWRLQGSYVCHNENAPACVRITRHNVATCWFYKGLLHRLGGPAIEGKDSIFNRYYIFGNLLTKLQHDLHPEEIKYHYLQNHPELQAFI